MGLLLLASLNLGACQSKAARDCQAQFQRAQVVVQNGASSLEGIDAGLQALDAALERCTAAGRDKEVEQMNLARAALQRNSETLKSHATRTKREKPTAAEVERLLKHGDPNCPKGMAYRVEGSDREIRCSGLQPVRMNWQNARDYYAARNFHIVTTEAPPSIRAEHGSELFVFTYSKVDDTQPPRCLTIYPDSNIPWQEAISRATGAPVNRLKPGAPIKTPEGDVAFRIDEGKNKLIIYLGDCKP